jgi:3-hydroxy-9,10-secoandrosta-1,3,5(10)-triene-9,17-dione monooxygenase
MVRDGQERERGPPYGARMSTALATPREMLSRAQALRPALVERQEETERLARYPEATHQELLDGGFYRLLTPRRYGGHEMAFADYLQVMIEIARGCPSTGWSLCLPLGHTLLLASLYPEEAQDALLGEHFFAASFGAPVGEAVPAPGGWELTGTWPYASGIGWSTHFMGQTTVPGEEGPMLFVAPRSSWRMLDDWGDSLGLRGSASHSVRFDRGFVDELFCLHDLVMVDIDVDEPTPGYLLHGNPMYAGRSLGLFMCELTAIVVGAGLAVADEYERIITTRQTTWGPKVLRSHHADYQRHLGTALGQILMAQAAVLRTAEEWTELCRRGMEDGIPYSALDDHRIAVVATHAARSVYAAAQDLFQQAGSTASRDGQRMQRLVRDLGTYWSHNTPSQWELLSRTYAMLHLGFPRGELPATGA